MISFHRFMGIRLFIAASIILLSTIAYAQDAGQAKLDEATELKLSASNPAELGKVIDLCEEAMEAGLDEIGTKLAKNILAASALQRAQANRQRLPRLANNPNALRNLLLQMTSDLDKAITNNPKLAEAYLMRAEMELLPGGTREKAINYVNTAIEELKDKPEEQAKAYMLRAGLQKSNDSKVADLSKSLELDPNNLEAWQAKIALLLTTGKLAEAASESEKLLEKDQDNQLAFGAALEAFVQLKRFDDALNLLNKRIEANPAKGDNYRWRGRIYSAQDKKEEALADLTKAIELNNRDFEALLFRGQLYLSMDENEKANRDISDSLLLEPDSVQGVLMRSLIAAQEKRYADAIKDMEMLVRFDPNNQAWVLQLASYYQADERPRLAIKLLDDSISKDKMAWQALRLRGDAKLSISQHREAIEDYRKAVRAMESKEKEGTPDEQRPDDNDKSGLYNNLSWVLATSPIDAIRNGKEALELALKACEATDYKEAHILSTLAAAYAETGDFEKAREWATKAVEAGKAKGHEQLEQLEKELEAYKANKPWREEQKTEENAKPIAVGDAIDT
jgi:tetratricopeptide (TPR) repeat protein